MASGYSITDQTNPGGSPGLTVDKSGNVTEASTLTLTNGTIVLTPPTTTPTPQPSTATIYATTGGTVNVLDPAGSTGTIKLDPTNSVVTVAGKGVVTAAQGGYPTEGALAESHPLWAGTTTLNPASGTLYIASVWLPQGVSVGHVGFVSVGAASSPTHWWTCILDNARVLRATSADQTSTAEGATTWFSLAMVTPYVTTYTGRYYLGYMATSGVTQATLVGATSPQAAVITGTSAVTPLLGGTSSTGLTVVGTVGSTTYAAASGAAAIPYLYAAA